MAGIGRKYSAWIYIVHPIFITAFYVVIRGIGLFGVHWHVAPFVVYGMSIVIVVIMDKLVIHCKSKVTVRMPR